MTDKQARAMRHSAAYPVYLNGDNEQPTTCPKCGARTIPMGREGHLQVEGCNGCGYEFIIEFDESDDD